jgi:hypothetical protein
LCDEAWNARVMSSVLKESLRGRRDAGDGCGSVEVILVWWELKILRDECLQVTAETRWMC